jgi:hypothetical protein
MAARAGRRQEIPRENSRRTAEAEALTHGFSRGKHAPPNATHTTYDHRETPSKGPGHNHPHKQLPNSSSRSHQPTASVVGNAPRKAIHTTYAHREIPSKGPRHKQQPNSGSRSRQPTALVVGNAPRKAIHTTYDRREKPSKRPGHKQQPHSGSRSLNPRLQPWETRHQTPYIPHTTTARYHQKGRAQTADAQRQPKP